MKSNKMKSLPMILGTLALLSFCSLIFVLQPAYIPLLNLSTDETSNIGSTIGGIVGPIVGMFSAYLLYEALTAQQEGNKDQRLKADSDLIFLLLNQLDQEYNNFRDDTTIRRTGQDDREKTYYGYEGLIRFAQLYNGHYSDDKIGPFLADSRSDNLLLIIRSFELIRAHIRQSNFSPDTSVLFNKKLNVYYRCKLQTPLGLLSTAFQDSSDPTASEILKFYTDNEAI